MRKLLLLILDGVGLSKNTDHNALFLAKTPHLDRFFQKYLHSQLKASGEAVGLPSGVMGNSEVGHLTIGSGRILLQDFRKISEFIKKQSFTDLPDLQRVGQQKGHLHIIGLVSDGGVHSAFSHLQSLICDMHQAFPQKKICIHAITDGRDTPPQSAKNYIMALEKIADRLDGVSLASVAGRFYAMDRDQRWDRTKKAYHNLVNVDQQKVFEQASDGIEASYQKGVTDEFILPFRIKGGVGIQSQDQCVVFNFRADRVRQIVQALTGRVKAFPLSVQLLPENFLTFTKYSKDFSFPVLFSREVPANCFGEVVSQKGWQQLRIAETEKYAHVTYFFNGGREDPFPGEDRILVPSLQDVSTYDEKPEMCAYDITDQLISNRALEKYPIIIANFANGDMVGHTANLAATIKAVEVMDTCLGRLESVALKAGYDMFITSDHGNCEELIKDGQPFTQHTTNPVPLIWVSPSSQKGFRLLDGGLSDVAPTLLYMLGCGVPEDMTGRNLIQPVNIDR